MPRPSDAKLPQGSVVTSINNLAVTPGSLLEARNVEFTEQGAIKPRRGFDFLTGWQPGDVKTGLGDIKQGIDYKGTFFVIDDDGDIVWDTVGGDKGITTETITADYANGYGWHRYAYMNGNVYYTTDKGIRKIDAVDGSPIPAGMQDVRIPDIWRYNVGDELPSAGSSPGAPLWLANNTEVRYKAVFGYRDANDNVILSVPSGGVLLLNDSGGAAFGNELYVDLDGTISTSYFVQLYRTGSFPAGTSDEQYYLVAEKQITSANISSGYVFFQDYVPDTLAGAPLYTNAEVDGAAGANIPPPVSKDLASFAGHMFYIPKQGTQTLRVSIGAIRVTDGDVGLRVATEAGTAASGSPTLTTMANTADIEVGMAVAKATTAFPVGAIVLSKTATTVTLNVNATASGSATYYWGDYITIDGNTVVGIPSGVTGTTEQSFNIRTTGTAGENIALATEMLVSAINRWGSANGSSVYAVRLSDSPGSFALVNHNVDYLDTEFNIATGNPSAFIPDLTQTPSAEDVTTEDLLLFSKYQKPEAVPLLNSIPVGVRNFPILRIVALQNSLIIFKQDGIYQLTGYSSDSFRVRVLDPSIQLTHVNSVAVVHNRAYALTDRGVISVGENDIRTESEAIHKTLSTQTSGFVPPANQSLVSALGIQDTSEYVLQLGDASNTIWCLNVVTGQWNNWTLNSKTRISCSWTDVEGGVFICDSGSQYVSSRAFRNTYDEEYTVASGSYTVNVANQTLTIPNTEIAFKPTVGSKLLFSNSAYVDYVATATTSGSNWVITLEGTWDASDIDEDGLYEIDFKVAIDSLVAWAPSLGDSLSSIKNWDKATLQFNSNTVDEHNLYWSTDVDGMTTFASELSAYDSAVLPDYVTAVSRTAAGANAVDVYSAGIPRGARITPRLRAAYHARRAGSTFTLEALDLTYRGGASRNNRRQR